jgi:hypothetical protein
VRVKGSSKNKRGEGERYEEESTERAKARLAKTMWTAVPPDDRREGERTHGGIEAKEKKADD